MAATLGTIRSPLGSSLWTTSAYLRVRWLGYAEGSLGSDSAADLLRSRLEKDPRMTANAAAAGCDEDGDRDGDGGASGTRSDDSCRLASERRNEACTSIEAAAGAEASPSAVAASEGVLGAEEEEDEEEDEPTAHRESLSANEGAAEEEDEAWSSLGSDSVADLLRSRLETSPDRNDYRSETDPAPATHGNDAEGSAFPPRLEEIALNIVEDVPTWSISND